MICFHWPTESLTTRVAFVAGILFESSVRGYCRLASSHSPRDFAVGFSGFADRARYQTKPPAVHALTQAKYNKLEQSFKK